MNGQKVFEALSGMTEEQRKRCSFWWLVDSRLLENDITFIISDLLSAESSVNLKGLTSEYLSTLSSADIIRVLDCCEDNMSEYSVDGYWDEYQGRYCEWFEEDVKKFLSDKGYLTDAGE